MNCRDFDPASKLWMNKVCDAFIGEPSPFSAPVLPYFREKLKCSHIGLFFFGKYNRKPSPNIRLGGLYFEIDIG